MPGQRVATGVIDIVCALPVPMRASPALATSGFSWASASPVNNQAGFLDNVSGTWATPSGGFAFSAINISASGLVLRMQAGASFTGSAGSVGFLHLGSSAFIGLNAEL
jgi:hypothetical protein